MFNAGEEKTTDSLYLMNVTVDYTDNVENSDRAYLMEYFTTNGGLNLNQLKDFFDDSQLEISIDDNVAQSTFDFSKCQI